MKLIYSIAFILYNGMAEFAYYAESTIMSIEYNVTQYSSFKFLTVPQFLLY